MSTTNEHRYQEALQNCSIVVNDVAELVNSYQSLLGEDNSRLSRSIPELTGDFFDRIRSKMKSQLINIVVCGAFSSGKSFLISGLIGRIRWYKRPKQIDTDFFDSQELDGYSSFLPSSPEQTNSCPLAVIPSDENRSRIEVLFDDTKVWEDKSKNYFSEDDIQAKMLAYITDIEQWQATRPTEDLSRSVIAAKLYVPMPLPAIIHDLPGIGGAEDKYLQLVHDAVRQADCVIYVASAIKELTGDELDLLRFVEEISDKNRAPVFFVLSQIDREPDWKKVLDKNNKFLQENFQRSGKTNTGLVGKGFVPVSPAVQAKAQGLLSIKEISKPEYDKAVQRSNMVRLHEALNNHLVNVSGPAHLREIIVQVHNLLKALRLHIKSQIQAETTPLKEAEIHIKEYKELNRLLIEKRKLLLQDLDELGRSALMAAFATTDADDLYSRLQTSVESLIKKSDVLKDSNRHKIEQTKKELRDEWLRRPNGLEINWNQAWSDYQKQTIIILNERLSEAVREASISGTNLIDSMRGVSGPDQVEKEASLRDVTALVSTAWQTWLSVTGIGVGGIASLLASAGAGTAAGGVAVAAAIAPLGFFLLAAGTLGLGWTAWQKRKDREQLRKLMIDHLQEYADQTVTQLRMQAEQFIDAHKGEIIKIVNRLISVQGEQIEQIQKRIDIGDLKTNQVRVELLKNIEQRSRSIEEQIEHIYRDLAAIASAKT